MYAIRSYYENSLSGNNDTLNNVIDTNRTGQQEETITPVEDLLIDGTNPEGEQPPKRIEIKKEEEGEIKDGGEDPIK